VDAWARERFGRASVARLATITPTGHPHLVPVVFALTTDPAGDTRDSHDTVWLVIDTKPKSGRRLQRLRNIEAEPRVSLLVDHYEDDWSAVWWVRADGVATILPVGSSGGQQALSALAAKYPAYAAEPPPGPVIRIAVDAWRSWSAQ
jgi:PPOX class probable F420-dependent enzyme